MYLGGPSIFMYPASMALRRFRSAGAASLQLLLPGAPASMALRRFRSAGAASLLLLPGAPSRGKVESQMYGGSMHTPSRV